MYPLARKDRLYVFQTLFPGAYAFCPTEEAWYHAVKKWGQEKNPVYEYPTGDDGKYGCMFPVEGVDGSLVCVICFRKDLDTEDFVEQIGVIVHEATHAWQWIKRHAGERKPGIETEAYMIQTITKNIAQAYIDTRGPIVEEPSDPVDQSGEGSTIQEGS